MDRQDILLSTAKRTQVIVELLDINERPVDRVQGTLISGGISINGDSAVRRVANLSFITTDSNYKILETTNDLSISKKVKIYIETTDISKVVEESRLDSVGVFVMSNCTTVVNNNSQQINITAQDKMCLHNGDIAGSIEYTAQLDSEIGTSRFNNEVNNMKYACEQGALQPKEKDQRCNEIDAEADKIHKAISGDDSSMEYHLISLKTNVAKVRVMTEDRLIKKGFENLKSDIEAINFDSKKNKLTISEIIRYSAVTFGGELPGKVIINDIPDKIKTPIRIDKDTIGYKMMKFYYPEDLTLNTGQPVTEVYERCKQALGGNYEYFYDIEGNFVFQEIKNYLDNNIVKIEDLTTTDYMVSYDRAPVEFDFSQSTIVSSYQNQPDWKSIKNDFYVWGNNEEALIGYRLTIDEKPIVPFYVKDLTKNTYEMDWREYIVHEHDSGVNNTFIAKCVEGDLKNIDVKSYPNAVACVVEKGKQYVYKIYRNGSWQNLGTPMYSTVVSDYYRDIKSLWIPDRYGSDFYPVEKDVYKYHLDIIEGSREISKFSVNTIGKRKKPIEDKDVKQLYPTKIEEVLVYYDPEDLQYTSEPTKAIKLNKLEDFTKYKPVGNIYKDAFSTIKQLLFRHTSYNEQISISSVPLYDLEVNRRVFVSNAKSSINGYFLVKSINFNLDNGMMNISLIKLSQRDQ